MPTDDRRTLELLDTHYGGDVSRVVLSGAADVPGDTVLAKRDWLATRGDGLRQLLLYPPYGEPRMCANLIVEPSLPDAQAGYIIMEAMGYPHFSGSNSICVVTALLESGRIPMEEPGEQRVLLEAPVGLVEATAEHDGEHVSSVTVNCDPAYVVERNRTVELPEFGRVTFDLVWSGCYYAVVDAESLGLALSAIEAPALAGFAHELCLVATPQLNLRHPEFGDTGNLSFVAFAGPIEEDDEGALHSPSATYVHPGVICSCPTGTGTAARLAVLAEDGRVERRRRARDDLTDREHDDGAGRRAHRRRRPRRRPRERHGARVPHGAQRPDRQP